MSDLGQKSAALEPSASGVASASRLTPGAVANLLPSRPMPTTPKKARHGVEIQQYRHPPGGVIASTGSCDHILVVNMEGRALIDDTSDGGRRQAWVERGYFSLTPAGQSVARSWQGRPEVLLIYLDPGLVEQVASDLEMDPSDMLIKPRLAVPDPVVFQLGVLLRSELAESDITSALMVDSLARALTIHLLRHHANRPIPFSANPPVLQSRRLKKVTDYMRAHLDEPISLPELAVVCGLSTMHFSRAFREAVGVPPHAYLIDLRLERARDLLEHTQMSITNIAFSCGFEQSQYFATVFRRKLGFTPSAWRSARAE